ncbi:carboxymuconolactone decarboxylase family protein [Isoptericola sp. 4D.3]|jgi:AhpD family alkylhydroperoxidase|uniref:Carboxymuconolactone decarboxylase family protein n=1 Tax=Isoptericola peretonis TaxID=2918523 RepID=A0ABT0J956_9MICO|nr:carboxymuconolactone decarboxylase family protein [Isoptericola sp. 4D.3]
MTTDTTTPTPATDRFVRIPRRLDVDRLAPRFSAAMGQLDAAAAADSERAGVDPALRELVRLRASQVNGCAYCVDLHSTAATEAGVDLQRLLALPVWRESGFFTAAERAALELAEAVARVSAAEVPAAVVEGLVAEVGEEAAAAVVALVVTVVAWNGIGATARGWSPARRG